MTSMRNEDLHQISQAILSERLREAREYLGLSQDYVSKHTGIPRASVSAIETGKRKVEALELNTLAQLYHYPLSYFLNGVVEESPEVVALAREARTLSDLDRQQVLKFAQFLRNVSIEQDEIDGELNHAK